MEKTKLAICTIFSSSYRSLSNGLEIAYYIEWKDPWEPFYIAPNHVPLYNERFKQVSLKF